MSTDQISGIILLFEKLFKKKITKDLEKIEKETQDDFKRKLINIEINSILLSNKQQTYLNKIVVKWGIIYYYEEETHIHCKPKNFLYTEFKLFLEKNYDTERIKIFSNDKKWTFPSKTLLNIITPSQKQAFESLLTNGGKILLQKPTKIKKLVIEKTSFSDIDILKANKETLIKIIYLFNNYHTTDLITTIKNEIMSLNDDQKNEWILAINQLTPKSDPVLGFSQRMDGNLEPLSKVEIFRNLRIEYGENFILIKIFNHNGFPDFEILNKMLVKNRPFIFSIKWENEEEEYDSENFPYERIIKRKIYTFLRKRYGNNTPLTIEISFPNKSIGENLPIR